MEISNPVFARQEKVNLLFSQTATSSELVGARETLPFYKGMKEKDLRALFARDSLNCPADWKWDELVRNHKEFIFYLQAAMDAHRMEIYDFPPTRLGMAKIWNSDKFPGISPHIKKTGTVKSKDQENLVKLAREKNNDFILKAIITRNENKKFTDPSE